MSLLSPSLIAFIAVVERGTVLDAAKTIGLTQTGVTQRIRALEKQLGVTLFLRSRKGMRMTREGESLFRYCQSARDLEGKTLAELSGDAIERTVEITVTGPSSILRARLIPKALQALKSHPSLRLRFELMDTESVVHRLKSGTTHIGVLPADQVVLEMDSKLLAPERYILVGPVAWKKRSLAEILEHESIVDFDPTDPMTHSFLEKNKLLKQARRERHFANNTDALASMLVMGAGYSVLSEEFVQPYINRGELVDIAPGKFYDFPLAVAWYPRPEMPDYFRDLLDALKKRD